MRRVLLVLALLPAFALAQAPADPPPTGASTPAPSKKPPTNSGGVYKWVDEKGVVHYTDKPPADNARPAKLPPLQTYKGGTNPSLSKFDRPVPGKSMPNLAQIDVVTPAREETFRGGERTVPVAVVVTPPLAEGQRLIYLLDGTPQNTPTPDTSFALQNVERGTHTVSVSLVDESGNTLATSTGVTFHMKPPVARGK